MITDTCLHPNNIYINHPEPGSMEKKFTILSVDDDQLFLHALKRTLTKKSFHVEIADNHLDAQTILDEKIIDLILLDVQMPEKSGLSLLEDIVSLYPGIPVLMLSGHDSVQYAVQAIKLGADDFLVKPFPSRELVLRLEPYVALWREKAPGRDTPTSIFDFPEMVGDSPVMQRLKSLIVRMAASEAPVLLLGESGTGKELGAKAIHVHSRRKDGPFVAVDCATLNETVVESELFGHTRGAFTGADANSIGLIRAADKGSLFLDEIGELPLSMQAKLLRTLQEQEVRPVGDQKSHSVDIRVIAATNRDLELEVKEGRFRADLYYRIAAIPLDMPPLRTRTEDILMLTNHFLGADNEDHGFTVSSAALRLLSNYRWPGNVRELINVLSRAKAFCETMCITPDDLPATIAMSTNMERGVEMPENDTLEAYEQLAFENAIRKTDGNRREAAALLGVSEATLYRKMKQYGLSN